MREAVMRHVEIAKLARGQQDDETAKQGEPVVQAVASEGGAMDQLMQCREQKDQQNALGQHRKPPEWLSGGDPDAENGDQPKVQRHMDQGRAVGLSAQRATLIRCQAGDQRFVGEGSVRHRPQAAPPTVKPSINRVG